jgi:hypothetical protein
MSIRTTVTLDEDVAERIKRESKQKGASFRDTLNELLRMALLAAGQTHRRTLVIKPTPMGLRPGLDYSDIEALLEYGEGADHR